jgi:hypothetical protein
MHMSDLRSAHAGDAHGPDEPKTHVEPVTLIEAVTSIIPDDPWTQTK